MRCSHLRGAGIAGRDLLIFRSVLNIMHVVRFRPVNGRSCKSCVMNMDDCRKEYEGQQIKHYDLRDAGEFGCGRLPEELQCGAVD